MGTIWLEGRNLFRLQAFGTLGHDELDRLSFVERAIAFRLDGGEMYENILPGLALNESVAFRGVKPLHCSLFLHW